MTAPVDYPVAFRFSMACELNEVRAGAKALHRFLAENGWKATDLSGCELALVEACNNAIQYAKNSARKKPIVVEALLGSDEVELRVTDHTAGFNWPEKMDLPAADSERGRGIFLIESLMDDAKYFRGNGENVLLLRKRRAANGHHHARIPRTDPRLTAVELEIAREIQHSLFLQTLPQAPGYSLAGVCNSAREVGGDYYDVLRVNDHSLMLVIADVMGKGIPAAMFASSLRTLLRATPELSRRPAMLMTRANRLLYRDLSDVNMFITAQLVYLDAKARRAWLANAGHCPVLLASREESPRVISPEGMPLGILPHTGYKEEILELPKECRMLLYTDGVIETRNSKDEQFGQERLLRWLKKNAESRRSADELKEELVREMEMFRGHAALKDDETFLIIAGTDEQA